MSEKTTKKKEENKQHKFLEALVKEQPVTNAIQKLNMKNLDISVYRHTSAVELLEMQLSQLDETLAKAKDDNEKKKLLEYREKLKNNVEVQEAMKIEGTLSHLTYKDLNMIKALVTEVVVECTKYDISKDVILAQLIAEERRATVFFALKKKGSKKESYFASLEEIGLVDDDTISDIFNLWNKHFVLTDEELKN